MRRRGGLLGIARLQSLCVLYILVWCLAPPLAIDTVWRVALAAAFASWFVLEGLRNSFARLANMPAALTLAFLCTTVAVQLLTGGPADVIRAIQLDICLVLALIGIAYRGARLSELEWLVLPVLAVFGASLAATLAALSHDPHAARLVVRTSTEALDLMRTGVGGYQLVYAAALLAPVALVLALGSDLSRSGFALALAAVAASTAALVLAAGYGIAVMVVLAASCTALLFAGGGRAALLGATVLAGGLVLVLLAHDPLLAAGQALTEGTKYAKKIADLRQSLASGESIGTTAERVSRYLRSLSLFAGSPLWGVLSYDALGKHSQILDTFARYGAPIGAVGAFVMVRLPALLLPPLPRGSAHAPLVITVALALYLGLNTATAAPGAVAFLLAPMLAYAAGRRAFTAPRRRPAAPLARRAVRRPYG